jgi:hypothetical protein
VTRSEEHDKLVIRSLRMAVACAVVVILTQVVALVVNVTRAPEAKPCVCAPEAPR